MTKSETSRRETAQRARLREEIEAGLADSRDPSNAGKPDPLTRKVTTIYSPWYTRTCPECKHKFREGDCVRLCPECGQAYHDDDAYQLYCWQDHFVDGGVCRLERRDPMTGRQIPGCDYRGPATFPDETGQTRDAHPTQRVAQVTDQFLHGLENVWTSFDQEAVLEVRQGERIVGHECPWCRFQIRAGDRVVKCPCGQCNTYFHNDIFRHLTCWDEWNGSQGNDYCPTTGAKIERDARPAQDQDDRFQQVAEDDGR